MTTLRERHWPQFVCSFAGSNMNVMINDISRDLHTTV
jgi:hypothetical protein